jgi:plastocyanin
MAELFVVMLTAVGGFSTHAPRPAAPPLRPRCATTEGRWLRHGAAARRQRRARPCTVRSGLAPRRPAAPVAPRPPVSAQSVTAAPPAADTALVPPPVAPAEPAPAGTPGPPVPPPAPTPLPRRLQVDEGEYYVRPSRRRVGTGRVEMNITNFGQDDHDLAVEAGGVIVSKTDLRSGQTTQVFVDVPAGTYKLYCTLQNGAHDAAGMHATLIVE